MTALEHAAAISLLSLNLLRNQNLLTHLVNVGVTKETI